MTRKPLIAAALTAAMLLTGCGASTVGALQTIPTASRTAPRTAPVASLANAPVLTVSNDRVEAPAAAKASTIRLIAETEMSEEEISADAQSYSVLAADSTVGTPFSESGIVRKTEKGFVLDVTKGLIKKTHELYTLVATGEQETTLNERVNKKAAVKGVFDLTAHQVTVSSVKKSIDLSALTDWLTKGKITGVLKTANAVPLGNAKLIVRSSEGYLFEQETSVEGKFTFKGLVPGSYSLTISKVGYSAASAQLEVKKRKNSKLEATLVVDAAAPSPSPAPTATPTPAPSASAAAAE